MQLFPQAFPALQTLQHDAANAVAQMGASAAPADRIRSSAPAINDFILSPKLKRVPREFLIADPSSFVKYVGSPGAIDLGLMLAIIAPCVSVNDPPIKVQPAAWQRRRIDRRKQ